MCRARLICLPFFIFFVSIAYGKDITICSWNLKDFGKSKSDQTLDFVARTLGSFDIIAIQEVVAGAGGPQAVAKLVGKLNKGTHVWQFEISPITTGENTNERYAFIWKSTVVKRLGRSWLDPNFKSQIAREPYMGQFLVGKRSFTIVNFHALPKTKNPEKEIKYFQYFPQCYQGDNLIFCGDFNLPQSHSVFNPLRGLDYTSALVKQKTSLRQQCINDDCLASEYDNFFFSENKVKLLESGVMHFYRLFHDLKAAKKVSDHLPIYVKIALQ